MLASLTWLKDYVDVDAPGAVLASRLTETLTETVLVPVPGGRVSGIVVARVVTVEPHPNADALSVCSVSWGSGSSSVVCGAPNVRAAMTTVLALPGAVLGGGRVVSEETIRGRRSSGMLVSEAELGMSDDAAGIIELGPGAEPGADARTVLGLDDEVLEIEVQPNRPDCLGMIGIAREIAAITGGALRLPRCQPREEGARAAELVSIAIDDPVGCPRYVGRVVRGVSVGPSPAWLRARLVNVGVRSINNVVDATNHVMLEWGHPIHAFDLGRLEGGRIVVRRAQQGETIETLDGVPRTLLPSHLAICDSARPVALAGVMGGAETEVTAATSDVLIECAWFDPVVVRRGARSLGLRTEASHRFERGVDATAMDRVVDRAASLIAELAGGRVAVGRVDVGSPPPPPRSVILRVERLRRVISPDLSPDRAAHCLKLLGFEVAATGARGETLTAVVPSHRRDVEIEADLIEEVARIHGYDRVEAMVPFQSSAAGPLAEAGVEAAVRDALTGLGFFEVVTTAFVGRRSLELLHELGRPGDAVLLTNPVNREAPFLRTTLLPSLLSVVARNRNVGERDLRVFEVGRVFSKRGADLAECLRLGGAMSGDAVRPSWDARPRAIDLFDATGALAGLWEVLKVDSPEVRCYDGRALDPGASVGFSVDGRSAGVLGIPSREAREFWDLSDPVVVFEIELDWLAPRLAAVGRFDGVPRYPKVRRDAALVLGDAVRAGDLLGEIATLSEPLLSDVRVFDVYRGAQLERGTKSLGLAFTYMSSRRTLTDREVDEAHGRIVRHLITRFRAKLRE